MRAQTKRYTVYLSIGILSLLIMIGISYAIFQRAFTQGSTNTLSTLSCVGLTFTGNTDSINLSATYPMSDTEGLRTTPFNFTVSNNCNNFVEYRIIATLTTSSNILPKYLKLNLSGTDELFPTQLNTLPTTTTPELTGGPYQSISYVLLKNEFLNQQSHIYDFRLWLDGENEQIWTAGDIFPNQSVTIKISVVGVIKTYTPFCSRPENQGLLSCAVVNLSKGTGNGTQNVSNAQGVWNEPLTDYRYEGDDPDNYVLFNNELWRIVGVFSENTHGLTNKLLVKIVHNGNLGNMAWDTGGSNNWPTSSLYAYLNGTYYKSINPSNRSLIENAAWKLGSTDSFSNSMGRYNVERGTTVYTGNAISTKGHIGLPYGSDFGFSVLANSCARSTNLNAYNTSDCGDQAWLRRSANYWLITHRINMAGQVYVFGSSSKAISSTASVTMLQSVIPSLYLKVDTQLLDGEGTISNPYIIGNLPNKIINDNGGITAIEAKGTPNFSTSPTDLNSGMYKTTDDYGTSYYFRGNHDYVNNWVEFAGFYWRIIRIDGNGDIRMIYNGVATGSPKPSPQKTGTTTQIAGTHAFNPLHNDNAYVGFRYGTPGSATYAATHTQANPSNAYTQVTNWYTNNLLNQGISVVSKINKKAVYCGDRNLGPSHVGYGSNLTYYAPNYRNIPTLSCINTVGGGVPSNNDQYALPVAIITKDEALLVGGLAANNSDYWLYTGERYWTMTPLSMISSAMGNTIQETGSICFGVSVNSSRALRPVITLNSNVSYVSGDGSISNPYLVN